MNKMNRLIKVSGVLLVFCTAQFLNAAGEEQGSNVVYIENNHIKLGVDLALGGAVTYLSKKGEPNMINSYDWGRQVQMSFYSGPIPFEPNGKKVKTHWKHLGWNPIQCGDDYGNRSKILEHSRTETSIYVKSIPMQWPLDNEPGECSFETTYTLEGNVVKAKAALNNNRSDKTQYDARSQELPAVYSNGPWYRLITYSGDKPFTKGSLTEVPRIPRKPNFPWNNLRASENWAALVDDNDNGFGILAPGLQHFLGGFAGVPGSGGPLDTHTGYVSPLSTEILDHNITFNYTYDLIVGNVDEIRNYVYANNKLNAPEFNFANDRQHWFMQNASDSGWPLKGSWRVLLNEDAPRLISPGIVCAAADYSAIELTAAFNTSEDSAAIHLLSYKGRGKVKDVQFEVTNDSKERTYRIPLTNIPEGFTIGKIYIDPCTKGKPGQYVDVKRIKFIKRK